MSSFKDRISGVLTEVPPQGTDTHRARAALIEAADLLCRRLEEFDAAVSTLTDEEADAIYDETIAGTDEDLVDVLVRVRDAVEREIG